MENLQGDSGNPRFDFDEDLNEDAIEAARSVIPCLFWAIPGTTDTVGPASEAQPGTALFPLVVSNPS